MLLKYPWRPAAIIIIMIIIIVNFLPLRFATGIFIASFQVRHKSMCTAR